MKGAGAIVITDVIVAIAIAVGTMFIILNVPSLVQDLAKLMELGSAETVAYDLAGLATISAAAPDTVRITYQSIRKDLAYTGSIKERVVTIEGPFKEEPYKQIAGKAKVAIDVNASFQSKTSFTIKKTTENGENNYEVVAS